jgi:hypothetical protein
MPGLSQGVTRLGRQRLFQALVLLGLVAGLGLISLGGSPGTPHNLPAGSDCMRCHAAQNFMTIESSRVHQEHFRLNGEHATLACSSCHDTKVGFQNLVAECSACHKVRDSHQRLVGDDCAACHDPRGWVPNRFRHVSTGTALTGAHRAASCEQCHAGGFPVIPTDCVYCHERDFYRERDEHEGVDILSCDVCHNTLSWGHARSPHGGGDDD